jgi:GTP cyclohydrolase I
MQLRYGLPAELVVARGIPFRTVCEHHLLPFPGTAGNAALIRSTSTPGGHHEHH